MKNFSLIQIIGLLYLFTLFGFNSTAQTYQKHPRAMELERQMTKDALDFLKSRFPDYPVIVTVAIDPIYRVEKNAPAKKQNGTDESLPYFRSEEDEILDEWDDPTLPNSVLLSRVKKIVVNVSVPGHLSDDEVAEIKQSLTLNLNLLPARDSIDIIKRTWGQKKEPEFEPLKYIWTFFGGLFFFFVGMLIAIWAPMRQISKAMKDSLATLKANSSGGASNVIVPMPSKGPDNSGSSSSSQNNNNNSSPQGDVRFSDPIKLQTAISLFFTNLQKTETFPGLEDMIFLDRICRESPPLMGAFILEANMAIREKIFSYSYGQHWLEALNNPGPVDIRVYEIVHKLNRMTRPLKRSSWDTLLLLVWRLDDDLLPFLKSLTQGEALAILSNLPKGIALGAARQLWPGSWATLLDPNFKAPEISADRIIDISNRALESSGLRTMQSVAQFKQDKDLMEFLDTVDPQAEREIYVASPKESLLHKMRPPFFKLFEANDETIKTLVESVALSQLALALSNLPKNERKKVEGALGPKQKIRYLEFLSSFESGPENLDLIGAARSEIANKLQQLNSRSVPQESKDNREAAAGGAGAGDSEGDRKNAA